MSNKENALAMLRSKVAQQNSARPASRRIVDDVAQDQEILHQASTPTIVNEPTGAKEKSAPTAGRKAKSGRLLPRQRPKSVYTETVAFRMKLKDYELLLSIADSNGESLTITTRGIIENYLSTVREQGTTTNNKQ